MKKVLWMAPKLYPIDGGQQMHSLGYIRALNEITDLKVITKLDVDDDGFRNHPDFADINVEFVKPYARKNWKTRLDHPIRKIIALEKGFLPIYASIINKLNSTMQEFQPDYVVIDYIGLYLYYKYLRKNYPYIKFIYNSHNVEFMNYSVERERTKSLLKIFNKYWIKKRKDAEKELLCETTATMCISKADIEILKKEFKTNKPLFHAKPLIKFSRIKKNKDVQEFHKNLMIVGSMDWYPNIKGVIWFIENVFDKLIKQDSNYKLYVVGRNPHIDLIKMCKKYPENIVLTGAVKSVDDYFKICDISVVPIFEGTGAKIKLLESICKKIPTICTDFSAKDYAIYNGEAMVVKQDANSFINSIKQIEENMEFRVELMEKMENYLTTYFQLDLNIKKLFEE